jgi:hypothetical protein
VLWGEGQFWAESVSILHQFATNLLKLKKGLNVFWLVLELKGT